MQVYTGKDMLILINTKVPKHMLTLVTHVEVFLYRTGMNDMITEMTYCLITSNILLKYICIYI